MKETRLTTSIKPELLKKHLVSSTIMGAIGLFLMILSSLFIPHAMLKFLGPAVVATWIILGISWIRPYIHLKKLSLIPDELLVRKDSMLYKGTIIPFHRIKTIHYIAEKDYYGLKFDYRNGNSLSLPYFNKQAFEELKRLIKSRPE